jgi:tetratricopeptide (TPR) repeat protein
MGLEVRLTGKLALIAALAAGCLLGSPSAGAAGKSNAEPASQARPDLNKNCPPSDVLDAALGKASDLMRQSRNQDAIKVLQPLVRLHCSPRAGLLIAAAFGASGDLPTAEHELQQAHSIWPSNNSIAASLAREYLGTRQVNKAAHSLAYFHATPATLPQEMEVAIVVYFAAHQLKSAQAVAEEDYKTYPSVHTLLLLANALQLQGRYPDVNRLLGSKRVMYSSSPDFLITLAESEYDASIYTAAREDIEHAIALDHTSYQAHYILGNVLARLNDVNRAIAEYHTAIELAPDQPRTYFHLALALRTKRDKVGEEHALDQALEADDHYAPAHCELGRILMEENHLADAVNHLKLAIQYNPDSQEAYFLLARAYAQLGEKDKSDAMVKRLESAGKKTRAMQR